ncbi:acyl-CoA thioesterase domain-containing protein [Actinomycetospora sp. TBRC 11914]|uniref:acyl-CoA thioesterase domain-containing protein n=1 Tax=Actinomycetospora sp. TBRC 11914 TaxID=2729387 RepID=UPI00145ED94D|nr:acyl-CoA thioesterase domain-containing protein [Actinomycetospora sp. TBRC 11914]NMO91648.1 hypothetical protein [Actinomycetospora sp. TBRC 11914]
MSAGASRGPARTSLDMLRAIADGSARTSPVATTFGQQLDGIAAGRVGAHMPPHPTCGSGLGSALVLADVALGAAISSASPDSGVQTLRLQASTAGPRSVEGEMLHGECSQRTAAPASATSAGEIRTDRGRVVATVSCRCAVRPASRGGGTGEDAAPPPAAEFVEDAWSGLGLCAAHVDHVLPALPCLGNLSGVVQGGVVAAALAHAAEAELGLRSASASLDLDVSYLRGVAADGSRLPLVVQIVHRGRRFGVARADVLDGGGRLAATATVSVWDPDV